MVKGTVAAKTIGALAMALAITGVSCSDGPRSTAPAPTTTLVGRTDPTEASPAADHDAFDVQGHRGARGLKPENTLPSFETALDLGVTTLEMDLHFTSDDELIVWHDPSITPDKCGIKPSAPDGLPDPDDPATDSADLAVRALTASQLRWYDCNRNPDPDRLPSQEPSGTQLAGTDFGIVTLGDLIAFVEEYASSESKSSEQRRTAENVRYNIETKRDAADPGAIDDGFDGEEAGPFELRLLTLLTEHQLQERTTIQSFDIRSLAAIHDIDPDVKLALITREGDVPIKELTTAGVAVWSPKGTALQQHQIDAAHASGREAIPWAVEAEQDVRWMIAAGVAGIITDRPDIAISVSASEP